MDLGKAADIVGFQVFNRAAVNNARCDLASGYERFKPSCGEKVNLVVEGGHKLTNAMVLTAPSTFSASATDWSGLRVWAVITSTPNWR